MEKYINVLMISKWKHAICFSQPKPYCVIVLRTVRGELRKRRNNSKWDQKIGPNWTPQILALTCKQIGWSHSSNRLFVVCWFWSMKVIMVTNITPSVVVHFRALCYRDDGYTVLLACWTAYWSATTAELSAASGDSRETFLVDQMLGLAVQHENAVSVQLDCKQTNSAILRLATLILRREELAVYGGCLRISCQSKPIWGEYSVISDSIKSWHT